MGDLDEPPRAALARLVVAHLEAEGVGAVWLEGVRDALRRSKSRGPETELLRLFREHGGPGGSALAPEDSAGASPISKPRAAAAEPKATAPAEGKIGETQSGKAEGKAEGKVVGKRKSPRLGLCGRLLPAAVVLLLSLVYLPCVTYSEWYIDELFAAVRNADARGETPIREVLSHDFWGNSLWDGDWTHKSYRPIIVLSYAFQYWFNGDTIKPQPLRAFNVALHSANCLLVYALVRKHGVVRRWACLAAGLFAVHPVHNENVVYLVGRADAMATSCWLLALLCWKPAARVAKSGSTARCSGCLSYALRLALVMSLAVFGGLCKESGFCVLVQLAASELLGPRPLRAVPMLGTFLAVFVGRSWLTGGTSAGFSYVDTPVQYHSDRAVRFATYMYHHGKYGQLLTFPWDLAWEYSYDALPLLEQTWRDVRALSAVTAYLALLAAASWGLARRRRTAVLAVVNVIVPFVPASNLFFVVGVTVGERLLYPSNVGSALFVGALGSCAASAAKQASRSKVRRRCRFPPLLAGLALLAVYVYRCGVRVHQWSNRELLFMADATAYPRSSKLRHQLGTVLHRQGRFSEALNHYDASLSVFKDSALTEYCLAQILIETGRHEEARVRFENIFNGHGMGFGRFNLYALYVDHGFNLMMLRQFEEAIPALMHGLSLNEDVPHGLNALGYSYMHLQQPNDGRAAFERGLHYDPENPYLWNNLGVALIFNEQLEAGSMLIAKALQAEPGMPSFTHNVQILQSLSSTGRWPAEQLALELFFNRGN